MDFTLVHSPIPGCIAILDASIKNNGRHDGY